MIAISEHSYAMGNKIHKKLLRLAFAFVVICLGFAFLHSPSSGAAGSFGFSEQDITKFAANPDFYFKNQSTIVGSIYSSVQKKTVQVTFTSGAALNQTNFPYPFADANKLFCIPDKNKISPSYAAYQGISTIGVKFSQLNPPVADIVAGGSFGIWPGVSASNPTYPCGKSIYPYVEPIGVEQKKVTTKNGAYTGPGLEFTKAVLLDKANIKAVFKKAGLISVTFPTSPKETVQFKDGDPDDHQFNFTTISSNNNLFCNPNPNAPIDPATGQVTGTGGQIDVSGTFSDGTLQGALRVNYMDAGTCRSVQTFFPINIANPAVKLKDGSTHRQAELFASWYNNTIQVLKCNNAGSCDYSTDSNWTLQPVSGSSTKYAQNENSTCTGWTIELAKAGKDYGSYYNSTGNGTCTKQDSRTVAVEGEKGSTPQPPPPVGGGGGNQVDCQTTASTSGITGGAFSWAFCPIIDSAQSMSDALLGIVEGQLSFTFAKNIGNSTPQVQGAWANMRNLASVFLVILMLVMVLSQAVSWGPFDAYTVRKVLPRLIIAVIMMQVSWSLLDWVVQVFDDIGHGIAFLIYQPFGGANKLLLANILGQSGLGTSEVGGIGLAFLISVAAVAVLSLPTIALIGWSIVLSTVIAWITLTIRQIFIIALVIFSPLAILAWILPGTEKYWKTWYSNFTKLLAMFPLVVGMVAVGRVFGWITAVSSANQLIKFVAILIGYFGPFFLIPKAFKWGGQLMQVAGQGVSNTVPKAAGFGTNWLKGKQERSNWHLAREARKAQLTREAKSRFGRQLVEGPLPLQYARRARTMSNPLSVRDYRRAGKIAKTARATREIELAAEAKEAIEPLASNGNWGEVLRQAREGNTPQVRAAALVALAKGRQFDSLEQYRDALGSTQQGRDDWARALGTDGDFGKITGEKRADLGSRPDRSIVRVVVGGDLDADGNVRPGITPAQLGTQHDSFHRQLSEAVTAMPDDPLKVRVLQSIYERYQNVARGPGAQEILGGPSAPHIDSLLREHARVVGGGPSTFAELVARERIPPPAAPPAPPPPGPPVP